MLQEIVLHKRIIYHPVVGYHHSYCNPILLDKNFKCFITGNSSDSSITCDISDSMSDDIVHAELEKCEVLVTEFVEMTVDLEYEEMSFEEFEWLEIKFDITIEDFMFELDPFFGSDAVVPEVDDILGEIESEICEFGDYEGASEIFHSEEVADEDEIIGGEVPVVELLIDEVHIFYYGRLIFFFIEEIF